MEPIIGKAYKKTHRYTDGSIESYSCVRISEGITYGKSLTGGVFASTFDDATHAPIAMSSREVVSIVNEFIEKVYKKALTTVDYRMITAMDGVSLPCGLQGVLLSTRPIVTACEALNRCLHMWRTKYMNLQSRIIALNAEEERQARQEVGTSTVLTVLAKYKDGRCTSLKEFQHMADMVWCDANMQHIYRYWNPIKKCWCFSNKSGMQKAQAMIDMYGQDVLESVTGKDWGFGLPLDVLQAIRCKQLDASMNDEKAQEDTSPVKIMS